MKTLNIGGRAIGPGEPCFIIAEAGVNHNGDLSMAKTLIDAAVAANVDAVKFQTFKTEGVMLPTAPKAAYQKESTGAGESQFDMVKKLELPYEAFVELSEYCRERGILFLSTPFDLDSVDFLAGLGVPAFKVPSGEVTNHLYLERIASHGKPVILSTGMSSLEEVGAAVEVLIRSGVSELALLHCVSNYPAASENVNLRAMRTLAEAFDVPTGYSDHTLGLDIAFAAVAMGATVIEKHFTLDTNLPGPDHQASLTPAQLRDLVAGIRRIESAFGDGIKKPVASEEDTQNVARRSLVLSEDLASGATIEKRHLLALRPSGGIPPDRVADVVGKRTKRPLKAGAMPGWGDLE